MSELTPFLTDPRELTMTFLAWMPEPILSMSHAFCSLSVGDLKAMAQQLQKPMCQLILIDGIGNCELVQFKALFCYPHLVVSQKNVGV